MLTEVFKAFLFLICLLGYFFLFMKLFKLKFEIAPFFTITLLACTIYIFALFDLLVQVTYVIYFGGILSFLIFLIRIIAKKNIKKFLNQNKIPLTFFIILYFVFYFITRELMISIWDEYSHWGLVAKEIFYSNRLTSLDTAIYAVEYPEMIPAFQYFVLKTIRFNEPNMFFANSLIALSVFILSLSIIKRKGLLLKALSITSFLIFNIGLSRPTTFIFSLYTDQVVALTFTGIILIILIRKKQNYERIFLTYYPIIPTLFYLTLIKETGFIFSSFIVVLIIILELLDISNDLKRISINRKSLKSVFTISLLLISIIVLAFFSWQFYLYKENLSYEAIFSDQIFTIGRYGGPSLNREISDYSITDVVRNLFMPVDDNKTVVRKMVAKIENPNNYFDISLKLLILISFIYFISTIAFHRSESLKVFIKTYLALLLEFVIYLFFLLFVYMFVIAVKGWKAPSFERYVFPFVSAIGCLILWFIFDYLSSNPFDSKDWKIKASYLSCIFLLIFSVYKINWTKVCVSIYSYQDVESIDYKITVVAEEYNQIIPPDSKVFHIRQDHEDIAHVILKYEMWPRVFQFFGNGFVVDGNPNYKYDDRGAVIATPEELFYAIKIGSYDYVLITSADGVFWDDYVNLFDITYPPEKHCLYSVGEDKLYLVAGEQYIY